VIESFNLTALTNKKCLRPR